MGSILSLFLEIICSNGELHKENCNICATYEGYFSTKRSRTVIKNKQKHSVLTFNFFRTWLIKTILHYLKIYVHFAKIILENITLNQDLFLPVNHWFLNSQTTRYVCVYLKIELHVWFSSCTINFLEPLIPTANFSKNVSPVMKLLFKILVCRCQ